MAGKLLGVVLLATMAAGRAGAAVTPPAYVSMGSSYAAGPGVSTGAPGGLPGCGQSADNYARQLARLRHLDLNDVSCGGATTQDILVGGLHGRAPQIAAVTASTRLVTVTIGGNDLGFVTDLAGFTCANAPGRLPPGAHTCPPVVLPGEQAYEQLRMHMVQIAQQVHRRAPAARLVFVDYVTLMPPEDTPCADLPLTPAQIATMRRMAARLAAITAQVARANHASILKASAITAGHAICSADPWSNGFPASNPSTGVPFHPKLPAMSAIARALDHLLST